MGCTLEVALRLVKTRESDENVRFDKNLRMQECLICLQEFLDYLFSDLNVFLAFCDFKHRNYGIILYKFYKNNFSI